MKILGVLITSLIFASGAKAQRTHEGDLSRPIVRSEGVLAGNIIRPDRIESGAQTLGLSLQFVRIVKGLETPVEGLVVSQIRSNEQGRITTSSCSQTTLNVSVTLKAQRFQVGPGLSDYQLFLSVQCGVFQKIIFEEKTANAQPIAIWQVATRAEKKLAAEVGLRFWKKSIKFKWPSNGDYYSGNTVNLTEGYQWDVVSHELGHAIYDQADIGLFGGGEHLIDRCYTPELTLSEGWASFFAAWLMLDLADPSAKFEYLVPRRAPIGVEIVPADVCGKSTNEWRVMAFLWDLIDTHDDGETYQIPFAKLWNDTVDARAPSLSSMKQRLILKGANPDFIQTIWKLNFPAE
jgi:hypothetical protein